MGGIALRRGKLPDMGAVAGQPDVTDTILEDLPDELVSGKIAGDMNLGPGLVVVAVEPSVPRPYPEISHAVVKDAIDIVRRKFRCTSAAGAEAYERRTALRPHE